MARKIIKLSKDRGEQEGDPLAGLRIDYRSMLNDEQLTAVMTIDGPVLIIAGAGSGKTRVITYRTAYLSEKGVQPEQMVLLTFTRRAATEMLSRAEAIVGMDLRNVEGGTFHSFASKLLRKWGNYIGLERNFTVLDQGDAEDALKKVRDALALGSKEKRFPQKGTLLDIISKARNKGTTVRDVVKKDFAHFESDIDGIEQVTKGYRSFKADRHLLDFDDLLFHLRDLLDGPEGGAVSAKFKYIMADEYQDTNGVQADIIQLLSKAHNNVCVVGDDAQCIYTWRGSSFENILDMEKRYPKVRIITLETNYRSCQPILDVANRVMTKAARSYTKVLRATKPEGEKPILVETKSTEEQAEFIAATVLSLREEGVPLHRMAVLSRAVFHLRDLELELSRRNIPYVVFGGIKFSEAAHVKDLLAVLRAGVNVRDDLSLKRILELLPRIGPSTSDKIIDAVFQSPSDPWGVFFDPPGRVHKEAEGILKNLGELLRRIGKNEEKPGPLVDAAKKFYLPLLRNRYDDHPKREPDLDLLVSFAAPYRSLESYLSDMMLTPTRDRAQEKVVERDDEDEMLVLSTVHSAKGLEFHTVFIPHLVDGLFPSNRSFGDPEAMEEERRLFYVAVTRAESDLYLCHPSFVSGPQTWDSGGGLTARSRFIDADLLPLLDTADIEWE
jgi:DNA helicase-2/ATP-dependent DNA helicase PcrA